MDNPEGAGREQRAFHYLGKEQEALEHAEKATDPYMRDTWLNIAQNWRFLADGLTRFSKL